MNENTTATVKYYLTELQKRIVSALETFDGKKFLADPWSRPEGGGGITCILEDGNFFERGGVGFSHVTGAKLPSSATANRPDLAGRGWEAMGVSLVLHPRNPFCPTVHMNVRFFIAHPVAEADLESVEKSYRSSSHSQSKSGLTTILARTPAHPPADPKQSVWWFGGGMDLTPYYPFEEDARYFHGVCRNALAVYGADLYPRFKAWCDRYFFLKHRNETRGVGGIFFDDFNELGFKKSLAMTQSVGDSFLDAYLPIAERRRNLPYGERERAFQAYRRGRYVEFNLVWDRGTLFGLQSGGRAESILLSMPPIANWRYNWHAEPGSAEAKLNEFLVPRNWLDAPPA